ncbi:MAG: FAD-dependent oxidoreductase [Deltaproteobacteria bacterium]|uniref:FAD-dependent oxidoreductase n=1 Tax=Candidatus Zymogenus saltonus TaxID=2844893 RepID=A0A9D8PQ12_9DELT|nr:FAD-dependent oxidoreductase [Candidatus Zymogenus saltonus]
MKGVTIYTLRGCPFCSRAKAFLTEKGIEFHEIEVEPRSEGWKEMKAATGSGSLPQIIVGGEPIGGYGNLVTLEAVGELWDKLGRPRPGDAPQIYDLIIIGGGPAGLSAAIYAARKLMKTIIISKDIGGQVTWTYDIDNYLGFSEIDTVELISKFEEHVGKYGVEKMEGVEVVSVDLAGSIKKVFCDDGALYNAKTVILAMGKRPRSLGVPGERELVGKGVAYCSTCDAPLFKGLKAAVVGGGNSALEAALDLINVAKKVYLISLTPLTGDPILIDKVMASEKSEIITEHNTLGIKGDKVVSGIEIKSLKDGNTRVLEVDGVFIEIGLLPNSELVVDTLTTNAIGEIVVDSQCRTGMAGVFAAGDVTDVLFKQVIIATGEGAKAALSAYNYIISRK